MKPPPAREPAIACHRRRNNADFLARSLTPRVKTRGNA